jgi:hypothetical protein
MSDSFEDSFQKAIAASSSPASKVETIVLFGNSGWMNLASRVVFVFRSKEAAHKYQNSQYKNVTIRILEGKWKVGMEIPLGTPSRPL